MRKLFTFIMLLVCLSQASAYEPFIREDRVWEYITLSRYYGCEDIIHLMRFDGSVEVNGKLYHRFVNYSSTYYPQGIEYSEGIKSIENCSPSYYREEGERVYVLTQNGYPAWSELDAVVEDSSFGEGLIFDFGLSQGEVTSDMIFSEGGELYTVTLPDVTVGGESCRSYTFCNPYPFEDWEEDLSVGNIPCYFIEGVGLCEDGILPDVPLDLLIGLRYSFLGRLYSEEGEILWEDSRYPRQKQNAVIYEDRIWEYTGGTTGTHRNLTIKVKFEGTEQIAGHEYSRLCLLSSIEWNRYDNEVVDYRDYTAEDSEPKVIGYVREEDDKVYTRIDDNEYLVFDLASPGVPVLCTIRWKIDYFPHEPEDAAMFVLSTPRGEWNGEEGKYGLWKTYMVDKAYFEYVWDDTVRQDDFFEPYYYDPAPMFVVGVGPCGMSEGGGTVLGFEPDTYDTGGGIGYSLNNVYDLEGNIIFEGSNKDIPVVGVSAPVAETDAIKIVYDLTGREVARGENATDGLTPGIYIVRKGNIATKTVIK
ncbi:MAG: T9SS type A sorting domain-containing protein [Muribaculaceae bacterium]|nr:T9SS type A sorting domain-containing protein [Muribaculaceae bacterium]